MKEGEESMIWKKNWRIAQVAASCMLLTQAVTWANELAADQLFEKLSPSVWSVIANDSNNRQLGQGSAVVISPGTLITNCHVLAKAASFIVKRDNVSYGASLQHADTERDLCQISVRNFNAPAVEIAPVETFKVGKKVFAIGNPRGLEVTLSDGLISGLRRSEDEKSLEFVQTTAPISPGSSGGGLFDGQGKLVGITTLITRDAQNLNFAIPSNLISEVPARAQTSLAARNAAQNATVLSAGPNAGAQKRGPYYVGQELEYAIIDRMTNISRPVFLKVSRFEGDTVIFNDGQRSESFDGRVLKSEGRPLSELDNLNALGGWVTSNTARGSWSIETLTYLQPHIHLNLSATFAGESKLVVPAGEFDVSVFHFKGHRNISTSRGGYGTRYEATLWFAKQLNRVIKFSVNVPGADGKIEEEIVLQRIR